MCRLLIIAAIILSCSSCNDYDSDVKVDQDLESKLAQLTKRVQNDTSRLVFRLDTLTGYSWDSLIIVTPYYPVERIELRTKIDLTAIKKPGMIDNDDSNVLAFIKNGQLTNYVDLPRHKGDFASNNDSLTIVTPVNSTFILERTESNFASGKAVVKAKNIK